jgi:hypothetical protein
MYSLSKVIVFCLVFLCLTGCQANPIGHYLNDIQTQQQRKPKLAVSRAFVVFRTEKFHDEGSLAGLIEDGVHGVFGNDEKKTLNTKGATLREELVEQMIDLIQNDNSFQFLDPSIDNPNLILADQKDTLIRYAQNHRLDMIVSANIELSFEADSLIGKLGQSNLLVRHTWHCYNPGGKRIWYFTVEERSEKFKLDIGLYDMREDQFAAKFKELARQSTVNCLNKLQTLTSEANLH